MPLRLRLDRSEVDYCKDEKEVLTPFGRNRLNVCADGRGFEDLEQQLQIYE